MKTTVNISDALHEEARKIAGSEKTTVKDLIEEGLRRVISEHKRKSSFHIRKATFRGKGLQPHMEGASWEKIREMTYEGRGG
ncbi:type II toxin-antitoxin system VapB family antitoxin [Thermodesulfobacteriota bacterium]